MPYSDNRLNQIIADRLVKIQPKTVLDVGAGAGKFAELIKLVVPEAKVTALEIDAGYIKEFNLTEKYHEVLNMSLQEYIDTTYNSQHDISFDLVVFGDVLEHLKKSEALDALNYFIYRSKFMLCVFPTGMIQGSFKGHVHEKHISAWSKWDFDGMNYEWLNRDFMFLFLVHGYLSKEKK